MTGRYEDLLEAMKVDQSSVCSCPVCVYVQGVLTRRAGASPDSVNEPELANKICLRHFSRLCNVTRTRRFLFQPCCGACPQTPAPHCLLRNKVMSELTEKAYRVIFTFAPFSRRRVKGHSSIIHTAVQLRVKGPCLGFELTTF